MALGAGTELPFHAPIDSLKQLADGAKDVESPTQRKFEERTKASNHAERRTATMKEALNLKNVWGRR